MIITKEMFDEFVESAENQSILWTDTLALIGVTVGDVPDVDVIEELKAEIEKLAGLVRGWHYLAVGPDEMGDYHTQKALIEASEPYAHPALKAPTVFATYTGKGWVAYATEAAASAALRARAALAQETQP